MKSVTDRQSFILSRYEKNKRPFPWREETDPYKIFVSEMMSQQTQISRVIPKYTSWISQLPTWEAVATVSQATIIQLRSGLGYNRRALYLQKAAEKIVNDYQGIFPSSLEQALSIPGIGPYTGAAVLSFAYNLPIPVIDINIKRVLIIEWELPTDIPDKQLRDFARTLIPDGKSCIRHNALMDYGAMVLPAKATGIKSPSQSSFIGSTRRVRGGVLKLLSAHYSMNIVAIQERYPHAHFDTIINALITEGFVVRDGDMLHLKT